MKIAYVRTHSAYDRCHIVRDDGSEEAYRFHAYRGGLPHELTHYAVEVAFGLRNGLWGSVARGLDLARANNHANDSGGRDKYRATFGEALEVVLYSELLTNVSWDADRPADCVAEIFDLAAQREVKPDPEPTIDRVRRAQAILADLGRRYRALGPKEALELEFPPTRT